MSSSTVSSSNFQFLLDALADYAKQTGIDLTKNPFAVHLQSCDSPYAILQLLQENAKAFKDYRDGNRKLIDCLSPVVHILHAFSGILDEATSLVSPDQLIHFFFDYEFTLPSTGTISPYEGDLCRRRYSARGIYLLSLFSLHLYHSRVN